MRSALDDTKPIETGMFSLSDGDEDYPDDYLDDARWPQDSGDDGTSYLYTPSALTTPNPRPQLGGPGSGSGSVSRRNRGLRGTARRGRRGSANGPTSSTPTSSSLAQRTQRSRSSGRSGGRNGGRRSGTMGGRASGSNHVSRRSVPATAAHPSEPIVGTLRTGRARGRGRVRPRSAGGGKASGGSSGERRKNAGGSSSMMPSSTASREELLGWLKRELKRRGVGSSQLMSLMDNDRSGTATFNEFSSGLTAANFDLTRDEYMRLYKAVDFNGDRSVSIEELRDHLFGATAAGKRGGKGGKGLMGRTSLSQRARRRGGGQRRAPSRSPTAPTRGAAITGAATAGLTIATEAAELFAEHAHINHTHTTNNGGAVGSGAGAGAGASTGLAIATEAAERFAQHAHIEHTHAAAFMST